MVPALEDGQRSQTGNVLGRSMALVVWRTGSSRGDGDMSKIDLNMFTSIAVL